MHYDVIIIGAGPGGLSCAKKLAKNGVKTLLVEKKTEIGSKVCAGGITWSGLIKIIPEELIERSFPTQYVQTRFQNISVREEVPLIATVNRKNLGQYMVRAAMHHNLTVITSTSLCSIKDNTVSLIDLTNKTLLTHSFDFLVGADGSSSKVRKHLELPVENAGIGINFQPKGYYRKMEWHLNNRFFKNGYGWIFPHKDTISIGAYIGSNALSALELKSNLIRWAKNLSFDLSREKCTAGLINYDYRGWQFDNLFLVGDAAGFASALTGEGIYPAIISGESVAKRILAPSSSLDAIKKLARKQRRFSKLVKLTSSNDLVSLALSELGMLALRTKLIDFTMLEMGK